VHSAEGRTATSEPDPASGLCRMSLIEARLLEEIQKRNTVLSAVNTIAAAASESTEVKGVMSRVLQTLLDLMDADAGTFSLLDERLKILEVVAQPVPYPNLRGFHRRLIAHLTSDSESSSELTAINLREVGPLDALWADHRDFTSLRCLPIRSKGRLLGLMAIFCRNGHHLKPLDEELIYSLANHIGVAIENTLLYRRLTERIEETEVLYQVGRTLISTRDHDQVLHQILKVVQKSLGYSRCGILLIDEERGELYLKAAQGVGLKEAHDFRLKIGQEGISGWVASTGEVLNVPDVRKEPRYVQGPTIRPASELALPLKIGSQVIGVLDVQSTRIGAFGERDIRILSSFADQAAIAIENARLYDRTREMGAVAERNRLAREIHDVLAQDLTGTVVQLEAADNLLVKGQVQKAQVVLRKAMEQARSSLQEARRAIAGLRATPLESLPLSEAIAGEIKAFAQETGILVSFKSIGNDAALSPDVAMALYRILKEGLSNIRRHSGAHEVEVRFEVGDNSCSLRIQDDGTGFDPSQMEHLGNIGNRYGLIGIRERARLLGGSMSVESGVATGTRLTVVVPLHSEPPAISALPSTQGFPPKTAYKRAGGHR